MKHYPHHISDFNNATRHLSRIERSLYRDLIELYYETEKPLPIDMTYVCRRIVANDFSTDVERMLSEFFIETVLGWYHSRCDDEISKYKSNNSQRALAGKASAAKKALKKQHALNGRLTSVEIPLNETATSLQNQSTNQPINQSTKDNTALTRPEDVTEDTWEDFKKLRKAKKAPLTATALAGIRGEVEKAGITMEAALVMACNRGWTSFNASWIKEEQHSARQSIGKNPNKQEALEARNNDVAERFLRGEK